jgi:putative hydrolase of the HAD superfamily
MTKSLLTGIRAVAFDAVGTLLDPNPKPPAVYHEIGTRYGSKLPESFIASAFREAFDCQERHDLSLGLATNEGRELERWRMIVASVLHDVYDREACFQELWQHFRRPANWRLTPGVDEMLASVRQRGLKLAVASNFDARLRTVLACFPASRHLHEIVISSEVGWRKPAAQFFAELARRLQCRPAEILFVGDHLGNDYEGATQAGMQAVLLDPSGRHSDSMCRRIGSLNDLLESGGQLSA